MDQNKLSCGFRSDCGFTAYKIDPIHSISVNSSVKTMAEKFSASNFEVFPFKSSYNVSNLFKNQHMHTISVTCGILRFKLVQRFQKTIYRYGTTLQDLTSETSPSQT